MKMLARAALLLSATIATPVMAAKEIIFFPPAYTGEQPRHIVVPDATADAMVAAGVAAFLPPLPGQPATTPIVTPPIVAVGALDFGDPANSALTL